MFISLVSEEIHLPAYGEAFHVDLDEEARLLSVGSLSGKSAPEKRLDRWPIWMVLPDGQKEEFICMGELDHQ